MAREQPPIQREEHAPPLRLMRKELLEDPRDLIASYLLTSVDRFSLSTRYFTAAYLLSHGIIKLWLIIGDRSFRTVHRLPSSSA